MNRIQTIVVDIAWQAPEHFLVLAYQDNHKPFSTFELKHHLFAWHESSYAGTLIEAVTFKGQEGLRLTAKQGLELLSRVYANPLIPITFSQASQPLVEASSVLSDAVVERRIIPDITKDHTRSMTWKLIPSESETNADLVEGEHSLPLSEQIPFWNEWLGALMAEELGQDTIRHIGHRAAQLQASGSRQQLDEASWLKAIGWGTAALPFRLCIQLIEPPEKGDWRLGVLLQDKQDETIVIECETDGQPYSDQPPPAAWAPHLQEVQNELARAVEVLPMLKPSARSADRIIRSKLSEANAWRFLTQGSNELREWGVDVWLPAWWTKLSRVKPRLKAAMQGTGGSKRESAFGLDTLASFDWKIAIGDVELNEQEFMQLVEQKRRLLRIRGRWVQLDPSIIRQIKTAMDKSSGLTLREVLQQQMARFSENAGEALTSNEVEENDTVALDIQLNQQLAGLIQQLREQSSIPLLETPAAFQGTLRHYQQVGSSWMLFLRRFGFGCCLADDMGLGKTIQLIVYLLHVRELQGEDGPQGPHLLICPTSVIGNWQRELERFAPDMKVHIHYGSNRSQDDSFRKEAAQSDLVITSYTLALFDQDELREMEWDCICLDEAQNIKNPNTKQSRAIRRLKAHHRVAMTGTPVENRLTELWSIFDFINPGYLGTLHEFKHSYANAVEQRRDADKTQQLQRITRPFLLRRMKQDPAVELDLPDKFESKTYISLNDEQVSLYEQIVQDMMQQVERLPSMQRRGLILASLTRLKQVCDHPALLLKESPISAAKHTQRSNKLQRVREMVSEIREEGEKCLIFTQFVDMGHILRHMLERQISEPVLYMHGGTPRNERERMIQEFQEGGPGVFILSLKAGGIGLNLTAANHVFHVDRWWNPAVENQATDRAFRIGQNKHVQVHKFVTMGTLEERIDELIEHKMELSSNIIGSGEQWITELSADELKEVFTLRMN